MPADSYIHCAERIVQEVDVCILIHGSKKRRETSGEDTTHSLGPTSEFMTASNNSRFIPEPRERAKTLLHTGQPGERGLHAHVHWEVQQRRGRMATETPFTWQG